MLLASCCCDYKITAAARQPGCGNVLRALTTTSIWKHIARTQGNDLEYSKNVKDWIIRRRESKPVMIGHDSVSETAKVSVFDEGLINLRMLKVQSVLIGNYREQAGAASHIATKQLYMIKYYNIKYILTILFYTRNKYNYIINN